jgi:hypothetical protein
MDFLNSKKAQSNIFAGIGLLVVLIIVAFIVWNTKFRYVVLGVGFLVMSLYVLLKADIKQKTKVTLFISLLAIGLILILSAGVLNSIYSVSSVNVGSDGKVYWVVTASADSIDEGYSFNYNPSKFTTPDGTSVTPKQALSLSISKADSYCSYQIISGGFNYKLLSNAERTANVLIRDGFNPNNPVTLDATIVQSKPIQDSDGKGNLTIKTQGLLTGKTDCPPTENVAIVGTGSSLNPYEIVYKDRFTAFIPQKIENTQFISAFKVKPIITSTSIKGDIELGSGVFIITADQDYFDSVIVTPPKDVKPYVDLINVPELKQGQTGSMSVMIKNSESSEGNIVVKVLDTDSSITPSSQNTILKDTKTLYFNIKAINQVTQDTGKIQVCGTNQFGSSSCSDKSFTLNIVSSSVIITEKCGDGICQSNENSATCSSDCEAIIECPQGKVLVNGDCVTPKVCAWYQEPYIKTEKDYGTLYWRYFIGNPKITETEDCKTAGWLNLLVIAVIVISLGSFALYLNKPKSRR